MSFWVYSEYMRILELGLVKVSCQAGSRGKFYSLIFYPFFYYGTEEVFERIVFLYHLERGHAGASYGLNVAALAGLPSNILQLAHNKSEKLEKEVTGKLSSGSNVLQTLKYVLHHQNFPCN